MIITISGLAGTGTSTLAKKMAQYLKYPFNSSGNIFRELAQSMNLSLNELDQLARQDSQYDIALDRKVREYADQNPDCVIDSRLAWHFVPESFKIKLEADDQVRIRRIADREKIPFAQAERETKAREEAIGDRYARYYGIHNFGDAKNFDLVIDTSRTSADQCLKTVLNHLNQADKSFSTDERR